MADFFGQPLDPSAAKQTQVTHLNRSAEVIFIKKVKRRADPGSSGEADLIEAERRFAEFIRKGILKESELLEQRDLDPETDDPRFTYWQVSTSSVGAASKASGTNQLLPNGDVASIQVNSVTKGVSTASIVLRNPEKKYLFKEHPLYAGKTIFDSDDLVYVNLPGLDGKLYRAFTGLITTVADNISTPGDSLNTMITIECVDMLKRLYESRTNVRPGFDAREANGSRVVAFDTSFANKLPHVILTSIFARAYCDFYSAPNFRSQLTQIRSRTPQDAAREEEKLIQSYSELPVGDSVSGSGNLSSLFITTEGELTEQGGQTPTAGVNNVLTTTKSVAKEIPKQIFGFRQARRAAGTAGAGSTVGLFPQFNPDDSAFIIEGTSQPAFQVSFASYGLDRWISDWQSSYNIVKRITDDLNFELNTTAEGVVRVRPLNIQLPADITNSETSATVSADQRPRVGSEYWLRESLMKSSLFRDTDDNVFTVAYVVGKYEIGSLNTGIEFLRTGIAVDTPRLQRLGVRMAPQQSRLELTSLEACQAYARAYLNRLNSSAKTGSVEYVGDARLRSGNPCYIPFKNRIYYIESLTHSFTAGSTFTTSLSLSYGRDPIAIATEEKAQQLAETMSSNFSLANDILNRYQFEPTLKRLISSNIVDASTKMLSTVSTEAGRYDQYGPPPKGNGQLVFQGLVWEDINIMTYEELAADAKRANTSLALTRQFQNFRSSSRVFQEGVATYSRTLGTTLLPEQLSLQYLNLQSAKILSTEGAAG